ncbi:unnamed protein product [Thlaspi arvense]|uniref:Uncharacterized protein n=1 Tax=Thlaspi arvense TaxID=13288 RepID=A0AAU9R7K5_THLAR|nr:unnamed protein product [Thlaspi arvense]
MLIQALSSDISLALKVLSLLNLKPGSLSAPLILFSTYTVSNVMDLCVLSIGVKIISGPLAFKVEAYNGSIPLSLLHIHGLRKITFFIFRFRMIASFQVANIIYLDQPVGTGFSYSRNPLADIPSDTGSVKRFDEFLLASQAS